MSAQKLYAPHVPETVVAQANRRAHARLDPVDLDWLVGARIKYERDVRVLDISAGGIRIETDRELATDSTLVIELAGADGPLVVPARVVRSDRDQRGQVVRYHSACVFRRTLDLPDLLGKRRQEGLPVAFRGSVAVMPRPETIPGVQKVVASFLDGRRLRGYTNTFHPSKDLLHLSSEPRAKDTVPVPVATLKALFFVRDFAGDPSLVEEKEFAAPANGRKIEVTFSDGETLVGTTLGYRGTGTGFFMFPADDRSNNIRIFVTPAGVRGVRFL
jgi:hypothetical protein